MGILDGDALTNGTAGQTLAAFGHVTRHNEANQAIQDVVDQMQVVVNHGATAGTSRPAGATYVKWVGSVEPTNASNDDEWWDTANDLVKLKQAGSFVAAGSGTYQNAYNLATGRYFGPGTSLTTLATVQDRIVYVPWFIPDVTIDRIAVEVTASAASSTVRLGAYTDNGGVPGDLLFETAALATTSTGMVEATISETISAGVIWVAAVAQGGTPTVRAVSSISIPIGRSDGLASTQNLQVGYWNSGVTGALPDPATVATANAAVSSAPRVMVRVA